MNSRHELHPKFDGGNVPVENIENVYDNQKEASLQFTINTP